MSGSDYNTIILHIAKAWTPTDTLVSSLLSRQVYSCYDRPAASIAEKVIPHLFYHSTPPSSLPEF